MSATFDLGGVTRNLSEVARRVVDAADRGLYMAGEHVLGVSNAQVPHEEGDFERGGAVTQDRDQHRVSVSYRDTAFPGQAEWLHENLEIRHDAGRNAKFLENAVNSEADTAAAIIAQATKEVLGG